MDPAVDGGLGERQALLGGEVTNTRACLSLSPSFSPSVRPSGFLFLSVRLSGLGISAPRPFPYPVGPLPSCLPARLTLHCGSRGPPVPSPGRRGARQLLLVRLSRVPASPGGLRARRQSGGPCPALFRSARLPAPQAAPAGTGRSEAPRVAPAAGSRRPAAWPRAAPAPPSASGHP